MNDKCAAGTGRFFEQAARILDTPLSSFGQLGLSPGPALELNSTCAVFAETEMVSLLAKGADKAGIVKALHRSVARRVGHLLGRGDPTPEIWLDGGPANNKGLVAAIEDELMTEVRVLSAPQYTVAYGAAITV
jgi:predicted CoA-substrate-specific enzyme activase